MAITFLILLLAILTLPGLCCVANLNIKQHRFLLTVSLSYGIFAFLSVFARLNDLSFMQFSWLIFAYLTLALLLLLKSVKQRFFTLDDIVFGLLKHSQVLVGSFCILLVLCSYYFYVGPYTEIPADIYYHIEKIARALEFYALDSSGKLHSFSSALKNAAEVWYYLLAFVALHSSVDMPVVVYWATLVSMSMFLIGIYLFSLRIFSDKNWVVLIALVATLLMAIHYGVTVFSYLRYYSLAPAMLAFLLYFLAVVLFLDILQQGSFDLIVVRLAGIVFTTAAAIFIHTQEAMYIAIQLNMILVVFAIRQTVLSYTSDKRHSQNHLTKPCVPLFEKTACAIAILSVMCFFVVYVYVHFNKIHFGNLGNRLLDLGPAIGILPKLSILNPSYQFMQVVTAWGVLVYLLFFLNWKRYQNNLYVLAGMLLPAFTIFNPFFTDLFLRIVDSTVLWRFCFLIPIHYVAADLFVFYGRQLWAWRDSQLKQRVFSGLAISSLLFLLLPMMNTWQGLHYSRYPTLKSVSENQSFQHLQDVIDFLETLPERKTILTDTVTGYVLTGFTKHSSSRDKFAYNQYSGFRQFTYEDYSSDPLSQYPEMLLVVNQRSIDSDDSFVGALARHWPADIYKRIAPFYTETLLQHLADNQHRFKIIYQHDKVTIYSL